MLSRHFALLEGYPIEAKTLAQRLKRRRIEMGFSRAKLGKILGFRGDLLKHWEEGKRPLAEDDLTKILSFMRYGIRA